MAGGWPLSRGRQSRWGESRDHATSSERQRSGVDRQEYGGARPPRIPSAVGIRECAAPIAPELIRQLSHRSRRDVRARGDRAREQRVAVRHVDPQRDGRAAERLCALAAAHRIVQYDPGREARRVAKLRSMPVVCRSRRTSCLPHPRRRSPKRPERPARTCRRAAALSWRRRPGYWPAWAGWCSAAPSPRRSRHRSRDAR